MTPVLLECAGASTGCAYPGAADLCPIRPVAAVAATALLPPPPLRSTPHCCRRRRCYRHFRHGAAAVAADTATATPVPV